MNKLFNNGYLIGSFDCDSIIKDDIDLLIEKSKDTNNLSCRYDIAGKDLIKLHFTKSCTYEQSLMYDKYVKETDENVFGVFQKWFSVDIPVSDNFRKLSFELIKDLYHLNDDSKLIYNDEYTMFSDGCFINSHIDNDKDSKGRICVVLIYLNKEIPEDAIGGSLSIEDSNGVKVTVEPKYTNYAILDFTNNNLRHEVSKVENWNRYAYVNFVSIIE
jgi:Rps23 Pro-64 3,4-dihydroxylase Tpa1-like proline 4-hydroxylase